MAGIQDGEPWTEGVDDNSVAISDANDSASETTTTINGNVEVANDQGSPLPVSGTVAVSGAVEVTNDAGNPLPVSGTVAVSDQTSGSQKTQVVGSGGNVADIDSSGAVRLQSGGTPGSAVPNRSTQVGGSDGTNLRSFLTDSGGRQLVLLSNGTTTTDTMAGDSGQNAALVAGSRKEVAFTTTTAQAVAATDVSNYRWVSVHVVAQGTSSNITFQCSNDGTNWTSLALIQANNTSSAGASSTTSTSVIYHGPIATRHFRLNVTGISAGTTSGVVEFFSTPAALQTLGVGGSVSQSGTWTVQPGNTANTTPWVVTQSGNSYSHISTSTTTTVKSGAGSLRSFVINTKGVGSTATLYDNTAGSGTVIAVIDTALSSTSFIYDVAFTTGLTVVTAGGTPADLTISYR